MDRPLFRDQHIHQLRRRHIKDRAVNGSAFRGYGAAGKAVEFCPGTEFYGFAGSTITPEGTSIYSPVFDVTPAQLVDVLVTEKGAIHAPDREKIAAILG